MSEQRISAAERHRSEAELSVASFHEPDLVKQAASWAEKIVRHERRWHGGTTLSAAHKAASKHGLSESLLRRLLYPCRWPQELAAGAYLKMMVVADKIERIDARLHDALERELDAAEKEGLNADNSQAVRFAGAALAALGKAEKGKTARASEVEPASVRPSRAAGERR